jgi:hypothetical protein
MAAPAAKVAAPEWTPPASPWQVEAKDITCLRYLSGEQNEDKLPMRIGMPTVLSIIAGTLDLTREFVEEQLRLGKPVWTKSARYVIAPEHADTATTRKP